MGIFFKKQRSKAAKIIGVAFFALLMFVNIQLTTNPNKDGDIDLFGIKISLATPSAYATGSGSYGHWVYYPSYGMCRCEPISMGDTWECTGLWSWSTSC